MKLLIVVTHLLGTPYDHRQQMDELPMDFRIHATERECGTG